MVRRTGSIINNQNLQFGHALRPCRILPRALHGALDSPQAREATALRNDVYVPVSIFMDLFAQLSTIANCTAAWGYFDMSHGASFLHFNIGREVIESGKGFDIATLKHNKLRNTIFHAESGTSHR